MKRKTLAKVLNKSEMLSKAIEAEVEEILADAENAVKITASNVDAKISLSNIEKSLENEGVEVLFNKPKVVGKTAGSTMSKDEIDVLAKKISKAVIDEIEDVLKDADDVAGEETKVLSEDEDEDSAEVEGKLKSILERKLASKGIYVKFERTAKEVPATKTASLKNDIPASEKARLAFEKARAKRK